MNQKLGLAGVSLYIVVFNKNFVVVHKNLYIFANFNRNKLIIPQKL